MSMQPQISNATGPSSFQILERQIDQYGREKALVQGPYGKSTLEIGSEHPNCAYEGTMLGDTAAWADVYYCSGCNYSIYYPIGD